MALALPFPWRFAWLQGPLLTPALTGLLATRYVPVHGSQRQALLEQGSQLLLAAAAVAQARPS